MVKQVLEHVDTLMGIIPDIRYASLNTLKELITDNTSTRKAVLPSPGRAT